MRSEFEVMSDVFCGTMFCSLLVMIHSFSETLVTTCQTRLHHAPNNISLKIINLSAA